MQTITSWISFMSGGIVVSLELIGLCFVFTLALAVIVAVGRISDRRTPRVITAAYVELFRGVPFLALLIFVYFGLGKYLVSLHVGNFWLAVAAISVGESAYMAELYRGAIKSVGPAQWDAARTSGLTRWQTLRFVILPQAVPVAIPPTINQLVSTVKVSSLASLVAVPELTAAAQNLISENFEPLQVYYLVGVLYLILTVPLTYLARWLERIASRRLGLTASRVPEVPAELAAVLLEERSS
jgi:His/Glu/Gln/Arg/opine family amino acid ABC transporter permease subunit